MPDYKATAIVLRRMGFGETDNILTLYSREHGLISAIAKGARKPISRLSGATEVLTCSRFALATGKSLHVVRQAEILDGFGKLRLDLGRLANGLYICELVSLSVEAGDPNSELFDLLRLGLKTLEQARLTEFAVRWFELRLLDSLGYMPQLSTCVVCDAPLPTRGEPLQHYGLSHCHGGATCPAHMGSQHAGDQIELSWATLQHLQLLEQIDTLSSSEIDELPNQSVDVVNQARLAMRQYIRYHLDREMRSSKFIETLAWHVN